MDRPTAPLLPRVEFLGLPIDAMTMDETVTAISERVQQGGFTQHVVVNVAKVVHAQRDEALRQAIVQADIVSADGMGVVWGARIRGAKIPERVAGIDLFFRLVEEAAEREFRVFILGARPEVLDQAISNLQNEYPSLKIAGQHHGYFWDDEQAVVEEIRKARADLLFVAISSPAKEFFVARWRHMLGVRFVMGVGGTIDIVAGFTRRAPPWMQKAGLEWFYRVIQEPRRMWRRYLSTNLRFGWLLLTRRSESTLSR